MKITYLAYYPKCYLRNRIATPIDHYNRWSIILPIIASPGRGSAGFIEKKGVTLPGARQNPAGQRYRARAGMLEI